MYCGKLIARTYFWLQRLFSFCYVCLYTAAYHTSVSSIFFLQCSQRDMIIQMLMYNLRFLFRCPNSFLLSFLHTYHLHLYISIKKR